MNFIFRFVWFIHVSLDILEYIQAAFDSASIIRTCYMQLCSFITFMSNKFMQYAALFRIDSVFHCFLSSRCKKSTCAFGERIVHLHRMHVISTRVKKCKPGPARAEFGCSQTAFFLTTCRSAFLANLQ